MHFNASWIPPAVQLTPSSGSPWGIGWILNGTLSPISHTTFDQSPIGNRLSFWRQPLLCPPEAQVGHLHLDRFVHLWSSDKHCNAFSWGPVHIRIPSLPHLREAAQEKKNRGRGENVIHSYTFRREGGRTREGIRASSQISFILDSGCD